MITHRIIHHNVIGSTNDEAKRLAASGEKDGTLITADTQTAGRGRMGRVWFTPPDSAIAMSLILRPATSEIHLAQLSLLGGLAVAEGIEAVTGLKPQLKWPNDVLIEDKKVAGVLAEASFDGNKVEWVVLGIGINVNAAPPPEVILETPATCLRPWTGREINRAELMRAVLDHFDSHYYSADAGLGSETLTKEWKARLAYLGKPVRVVTAIGWVEGALRGVTSAGNLTMRLADGSHREFLAGDVHLRRM